MADVFSPTVMTLTVNKMQPVKTTVLTKVFARKKRSLTTPFAWDVKKPSNLLMSSIAVDAEATVRGGIGKTHVTCPAPRFSEKEMISAADINEMRKFGETNKAELLKERIAEEQSDMKRNFDLTREFMAVRALSGLVIDGDGKVLVDLGLPAAHKPVLAGADSWADEASDPIANLRAWKKLIVQACGGGVTSWEAFSGSDAMTALIKNPSVQELLKFTSGSQIAEKGRVAQLAEVNIEEYSNSYVDTAGDVQDMIPEDVFALVGIVSDGAAELYAPVIDLDAPGGVGKGKEADIFFSKQWDEKDPSGKWVKVEGRPLPVLTRIIVVWATVV
jgi:Phage major capsid protein E